MNRGSQWSRVAHSSSIAAASAQFSLHFLFVALPLTRRISGRASLYAARCAQCGAILLSALTAEQERIGFHARGVTRGEPMASFTDYLAEAHQVFDDARVECHRTGLNFLTTELSLSRSFAEQALAAFSTGDVRKAKQAVPPAKAAYRAVQRFLTKVPLEHHERGMIIGELGRLTPLLQQLAAIK